MVTIFLHLLLAYINFLHKEMPGGIASEMIRDNNLKMPLYQNVEVNGKVVTMEKMGSIAYIKDRSEAIQAYYAQLESRRGNLKLEEHSMFGHFWKAHDQTNPTRYGTKCNTDTTHIIKFFLKFSSIKQTAPSSEN